MAKSRSRPIPESLGPKLEFVFESERVRDTHAVDAVALGESLIAIAKTLRHTSRALTDKRTEVEYTVTALSFNSPPVAVLQGKIRSHSNEVLYQTKEFFVETIEKVQSGQPIPGLTPELLRSYHDLGEVVRRTRLTLVMRDDVRPTVVRPKLAERLALVLPETEDADGSVEGYLKFINLHGGKNVFRIYPPAGPPYVTCRFPMRLVREAKAAVDEYVSVTGTLVYKPNDAHPYRVQVRDIEVLRRAEEGPTFDDLWGVARQPGVTSKTLLDEARHGWT